MYKCYACGNEFSEEAADERMEWDYHSELAGSGWAYDKRKIAVCPSCGSDALEEGNWCHICADHMGEEIIGTLEVCEECLATANEIISDAARDIERVLGVEWKDAIEFIQHWLEERW